VKGTAYEREEQRKGSWLRSELKPGMEAGETEFVTLDAGFLPSRRDSSILAGGKPAWQASPPVSGPTAPTLEGSQNAVTPPG